MDYHESTLRAFEIKQVEADHQATSELKLAEFWITPGQDLYPYQDVDTFLEGLCEYSGDLTPIVDAFRVGDFAEAGRLINDALHSYFLAIAMQRAEGWDFS